MSERGFVRLCLHSGANPSCTVIESIMSSRYQLFCPETIRCLLGVNKVLFVGILYHRLQDVRDDLLCWGCKVIDLCGCIRAPFALSAVSIWVLFGNASRLFRAACVAPG